MTRLFSLFLILFSIAASAQVLKSSPDGGGRTRSTKKTTTNTNTVPDRNTSEEQEENKPKKDLPKATIDMYKVVTLERDTMYIDTSLTIQKEYSFNYLRRDNFGLLPFANDGQTYNTLQYSLNDFSPYPEFGFNAKQFNYLKPSQMWYYQVPTPLTELYFKTTIKQGQSLDAFITVNTSERLNFSIAYKGLRSEGRYNNALSSTGNFRFTANYQTKDARYSLKAHLAGQDVLNEENGGIVNTDNFESGDSDFKRRDRLQVYLVDAESFLKGIRYFVDHSFRFNKTEGENNLYFTHQFNFEKKLFEFNQPTLTTTITGTNTPFNRFGDSNVASSIHDKTRYDRFYNKVGAVYENKTLGRIGFFIDDFHYNYYYDRVIVQGTNVIPSALNDRINSFGAEYAYQKGKWNGRALYSNSLTDQDLSNFDVSLNYDLNDDNHLSFQYQKINKLPDNIYNLYQSSYIAYNWYNEFNNEKINNFRVKADTKWASAELQYTTLNDKLYFSDDSTTENILLVSPKQYGGTINYLSLKVSKEFKWWKLALDNTLLYQKTDQSDDILNVPQLVTRNTLYFSDYVFKKAMFLQTGVTFNYFTKYYANNYNPVIGEFYVQHQKEIGEFPMFDVFVNARVRQTRIYLKWEHFNSSFTGNTFYAAPNYPYKDALIRFGLVWNFFQ
ncbi:putative porin [Flavobacterium sp. 3HN19-14]|uniref:putative porin n=1 Tax=Flavobacterium sp. 3HN19-14 TaxID=3448133 RepID=UPI003EE290A0